MLDVKWIRENKEQFNDYLQTRGIDVDIIHLLSLDEKKRQIITLAQQLQQARKTKSKFLSTIRNKNSGDFTSVIRDVEHINEKLVELSKKLAENNELQEILDNIPNILDPEVPYGTDESMNKIVRKSGDPVIFPYGKEHYEIGKSLGLIDFEQTAKVSGSRFVTLKGKIAKLERALINFMIDIHTENYDFLEISPPVLVRSSAMYNVGQLPKFNEDSYLTEGGGYRLIPSGEVPLTNLVADSILKREDLPQRYVAYTECFRSEAGSAGKDARGMIRSHQFGKVELVSITTEEESNKEHEYIVCAAEEILKQLEIPYRIMLLCSGDVGFSSKKTYDIEAWLPGQKKYREISSVSNCGDFQARRMKARYKEFGENQTKFVHTLNGSGLAVGRTIVAILENYQNEDGSVTIPSVLVPYMNGETKIESEYSRQ